MSRILVIDDDKLFLTLAVQWLKNCGHDVQSAPDGAAGQRVFEAAQFDVVVCDLVMPNQEGIETIRVMRRQRPDVGIVAISGGLRVSTSFDILFVAKQLGADEILQKPFGLPALSDAVTAAIKAHDVARANLCS